MQPFSEYKSLDRSFWAHVKLVSERLRYSDRKTNQLRRYSTQDVEGCLQEAGLSPAHLYDPLPGQTAPLADTLVGYLNRRAETLEEVVQPVLMDRDQAAAEFRALRKRLKPKCALPMNKQKGKKRHHAYLVGIVNMLTEHALEGRPFDDEPRGLTLITKNGRPIRMLSRWMDGAYPSRVNPYAVWEVKEYYGTTTFGSRVADGVYETMLDGEELAELQARENIKVYHYLMVDDRFTWWDCGRSYLCRIIDMLHIGLVDEALFGREVLARWPTVVKTWPKDFS